MMIDNDVFTRDLYESDASYNARLLWNEFKDSVFYDSRYFVKHELLDMLAEYISKNVLVVEVGTMFHRARIIDDSCIKDHMLGKCLHGNDMEHGIHLFMSKENPFKGLSKEASFVPPRTAKVGEGRANPRYVKYLYVAEEPLTAIFEVRPLLYDSINVSKIRVNEPLKIANVAVDLRFPTGEEQTMEMYLMQKIQGAFSKPTNNSDDYIPTQVISEYLRSLGYDGIRFNSSLHVDGVNLTIFNFAKCEAVASQEFKFEGIKITARAKMVSSSEGEIYRIDDNVPKYWGYDSETKLI